LEWKRILWLLVVPVPKEKIVITKSTHQIKDFNKVPLKVAWNISKKVELKFNEDFGKEINNTRIKADIGNKIYSDLNSKILLNHQLTKKRIHPF
jgi:hypothetical protein